MSSKCPEGISHPLRKWSLQDNAKESQWTSWSLPGKSNTSRGAQYPGSSATGLRLRVPGKNREYGANMKCTTLTYNTLCDDMDYLVSYHHPTQMNTDQPQEIVAPSVLYEGCSAPHGESAMQPATRLGP